MIAQRPPHELLLTVLQNIRPISSEIKAHLYEKFEVVKIKKHKSLIEEGRQCNHLWFIVSGSTRAFGVQTSGKEITSRLMPKGYFVTAVRSFFERQPGFETIEAMEDCLFLRITHRDFEHLHEKFPEFNYHSRILAQQYAALASVREYMLRYTNATERYAVFEQFFAHLHATTPIKYLASFAQMERATFTNIKNGK